MRGVAGMPAAEPLAPALLLARGDLMAMSGEVGAPRGEQGGSTSVRPRALTLMSSTARRGVLGGLSGAADAGEALGVSVRRRSGVSGAGG